MSKLIPLLLAAIPLAAQVNENYSFRLENGAEVVYQTYSDTDMRDLHRAFGTAAASGNVIRRSMRDGKGDVWLAFEVHIGREPGTGPIRFLISMQPLGGAAFFMQKAEPRVIENGDRVLLDVLEEPGTGRKIWDTFQVGIGVGMQAMPLAHSVPQVPAPGTVIHIHDPRFMSGLDVFAQATGVISGTKVAISVPEKGRFLFSTQPEPGFRMEAVVDHFQYQGPKFRLSWVLGNDAYGVSLSAPLIEGVKSSYLWVKREDLDGRPTVPNLDLIKAK
jgi:hypothetical protein